MSTDGGVGKRIREARDALGWTQAKLAEKIGADSVSVIKNWEGRTELPSRYTPYLERLEHVLNITLRERPVVDTYDPPVSQAPDALLIAEVARRMAARIGPGHDQSNVTSFEIAGMSFEGQQSDETDQDGPA